MGIIRKKIRGDAEVHVGPLNDILFILLLFFLIVSTLANPNVIKLSPPKSESDTKVKQSVAISIDADGNYYINQSKVNFGDIAFLLETEITKQQGIKLSVVINADKTVPIDDVVQVMRIAKRLGLPTALSTANPTE